MKGDIEQNIWSSLDFFPEKISEPYAWFEHTPSMSFLKKISPATHVELGTHTGNSYFSACQTVQNNSLQTKCFAIDTWSGDDHAGYYENSVFDSEKLIAKLLNIAWWNWPLQKIASSMNVLCSDQLSEFINEFGSMSSS
ncbi:hypothetical protein G6730_05170 [Polynucleobacter paneuropaeus]|nr:hypothetical protein [Polynucleobacter paneuropaeus]